MAQWKFQLCPNKKDVVAVGYRLDPIGQAVETMINDALSYPFRFHGVNKIVIRLGPPEEATADYREVLGVGMKQYPDFHWDAYVAGSPDKKREMLIDATKNVFRWLLSEFDDVDFVRKGVNNLGWSDIA